jgi:hypothetical protein
VIGFEILDAPLEIGQIRRGAQISVPSSVFPIDKRFQDSRKQLADHSLLLIARYGVPYEMNLPQKQA